MLVDDLRSFGRDLRGVDREVIKQLLFDAANALEAAYAQTGYLSGCLHPGNEPLSCQYEGQCLSVSCDHHGKTVCRPRRTVEAQVDGILYPKGDRDA